MRHVMLKGFLTAAIGLMGGVAADAAIIVSGPTNTQDTYLANDGDNVDVNYGDNTSLQVGFRSGSVLRRSLIRFELPTLPDGYQIESVKLRLWNDNDVVQRGHASAGAEAQTSVYRALKSWDEATATWNDRTATDEWNGTAGPTNDAVDFADAATTTATYTLGTDEWFEFDVTADVQAFYAGTQANHGWLLRTLESSILTHGRWEAVSSERADHLDDKVPQLVIEGSVPEPAAMGLLGLGATTLLLRRPSHR